MPTSPFHQPQPRTNAAQPAKLRLWVLGLAFASALSACGGGDDGPAPEPPAPAPAPTPAPAPVVPRKPPQARLGEVPEVLLDTHRVDGSMNDGAPLPAPLSLIAPRSSMPNLAQNGLTADGINRMEPGRALLADGSFVYLDRLAMQIVRVSPTGEVRTQPSPGRPNGGAAQGFWNPTAFAVDKAGNAYVADGWYPEFDSCFGQCQCARAYSSPMGERAWAGVWRVTPAGEVTRVSGVMSGDVLPGGMQDGDKDSARFSAITQMMPAADGGLYVIDEERVVAAPSPSPELVQYVWKGKVLRHIAPDGAVRTVLPAHNALVLFRRSNGGVGYQLGYVGYDAVTGVEIPGETREAAILDESVDQAGNLWRMGSFLMHPAATGLPRSLRLFVVSRFGVEGEYLPGSLLLHWGCSEQLPSDPRPPTPIVDTCQSTQLGVAQNQLYGLINAGLVRVDVQSLLPK